MTLEPATIPDHVPDALVAEWDHYNDPRLLRDPHRAYGDLRARHRIFFSPLNGGFWVITRYEDIFDALRRTDLWSSKYLAIPARDNFLMPINLDPPDHTKYRRLVIQAFTPSRIRALEDSIRESARTTVTERAEHDTCEFMNEVARPYPATIFSRILGTPGDQWPRFMNWNHTILHVGDMNARADATSAVTEYLRELIAQRAADPQHDLLSSLLTVEVDGERLTEQELLSFAVLLFMAGLDTVSGALGFIFGFLAQSPDHRRQLVNEPELVRPAVEELIRYSSNVQLSRTATTDFQFAGVQIKAGDRLMLPLISANRDDRAFPDPDRVDFRRTPNRHIAFATGPHLCLGAHLARHEIAILLEEWHRQIPDYQLPAGHVLAHHGGGLVNLNELPLQLGSGENSTVSRGALHAST